MIGERQITDKPTSYWGRIEISPRTASKSDVLLNVMYVTDADSKASATPTRVTSRCGHFEGADVCGITALFSTEKLFVSHSVEFDKPTDGDCYVSGLAAGLWSVYSNGEKLCERRVRTEEGLIAFNTKAGAIKLVIN